MPAHGRGAPGAVHRRRAVLVALARNVLGRVGRAHDQHALPRELFRAPEVVRVQDAA